ncbi:suppressor of fused domain protein [Streptomyces acidiscabies]|uniref:suppressor of fused domain protein n=1 Tax=Streptomyces acidiscabies TaxID=42234 RepID=UPI0021166025|nr:suppressor of fused domain protein [Streptomyces acidiscabies]
MGTGDRGDGDDRAAVPEALEAGHEVLRGEPGVGGAGMNGEALAGGEVSEVEAHVRAFFAGHAVEATDADVRVLTVSPGPRVDSWSYVTVGCSDEEHTGLRREFVMTGHVRDERFVDLMTMLATYHRTGHPLDVGHSLPIGEPWLPGSRCDHLLISVPYSHGPALEHAPALTRILWALPVTPEEIAYRRAHGTEALEQLFDDHALLPTDPHRESVV